MRSEITAAPALPATTLFLGGGTPNLYPADDLVGLVTLVREHFALPNDAEISIECNPDLALCESFASYVEAGITRVSFGVQSFVPHELKTLGRRHRSEDVVEVVRRARAAGLQALSLDLIFGTPGQTLASLDVSLDAALALDLPHLSVYGLTVEEGTPYATWRSRMPQLFDDDVKDAALYERVIERLSAAGYEHYELSNFARPGSRSEHNTQYWNNDEYMGFGLGAASYQSGTRSVRTRDYQSYVAAVEAGRPVACESEHLTPAARLGEAIMLALRRREGVDAAEFARRYQVDVCEQYAAVLQQWQELGLLEWDTQGFRLSAAGRPLANEVCAAFLAPAEYA